jgi:molybdopterin/thiamine biosynthesis adenylyltransferase
MLENPIILERTHTYKMFRLINGNNCELENVKILIVGVGGIGCEILKVLSKVPIGEVDIVDMDTIEVHFHLI